LQNLKSAHRNGSFAPQQLKPFSGNSEVLQTSNQRTQETNPHKPNEILFQPCGGTAHSVCFSPPSAAVSRRKADKKEPMHIASALNVCILLHEPSENRSFAAKPKLT
jgi:hypothetical protein